MTQPSIFDRLRSMQTEGLPLHTLIVEACEVGNDLIYALDALVGSDLSYQGRNIVITCDSHGWAIKRVHEARTALARAYPDNSNGNGSNGSNRSAA